MKKEETDTNNHDPLKRNSFQKPNNTSPCYNNRYMSEPFSTTNTSSVHLNNKMNYYGSPNDKKEETPNSVGSWWGSYGARLSATNSPHGNHHQGYSHSGVHSPRLPFTTSQPFSPMLAVSPKDLEAQLYERFENLQEMRPYRLIGDSKPWYDWGKFIKCQAELKKIKNKKVGEFYEKQNGVCQRYIEIDQLLDSGISVSMLKVYGDDLPRINEPDDQRQGAPANIDTESSPLIQSNQKENSNVVMFAIYVNFVINVVLLAGKIFVAVLTNSLSVIASLVDSILDFLSTVIIWISTRLVGQRDWQTKHLYPVGRNRLEPIGVLVFSILIIVSFLQIANEATQKLVAGKGDVVNLGLLSTIIMILTVVVKVFCWIWCKSINSSAVQALAQDAMTDVVFNTFSIVFPLLSHFTKIWWFDPLGALLLSCYIIWSWGSTALEHINNLTGTAASNEERQVLLYASARFAESIRQITCLNAYHTGDLIMVEVDLVLDGTLSLKDSHDIGEALQYALETLPFVERAFVHLDYRTGNFTGHIEN